MRRKLIVMSVVLTVSIVAQEAMAQMTSGRSAPSSISGGARTFTAGSGTGGQGASGNFGVGTAGEVASSDRFVRDNRQGAFVGVDSGDTAAFVGSVGATANQGNRTIRRGGGGATNVNQGGQRRQKTDIRITLSLGFAQPIATAASPHREPSAVAARLAGKMERSTWIQNLTPLDLTIDQGTATLRGVVATEHDRLLVERLVLLEGGIWSVNNELQVQETAAEPDAPALLEPAFQSATE